MWQSVLWRLRHEGKKKRFPVDLLQRCYIAGLTCPVPDSEPRGGGKARFRQNREAGYRRGRYRIRRVCCKSAYFHLVEKPDLELRNTGNYEHDADKVDSTTGTWGLLGAGQEPASLLLQRLHQPSCQAGEGRFT